MKKINFIFLFLFTLSFIKAQSLSGIKLCIDPGHGGHNEADDRHVMPPDFWESESNFGKALHVREILQSLGATVILTRNGNSDADDISLSARDAIANANNVDYFHSIHSNATGTANRVNFPLILFRGYDTAPVFPASKVFANIVFTKIRECRSGTWSNSNTYVRGDFDFYDWKDANGNPLGLGVLRYLQMPGTLSEGSFHDYIPEAWRLKNSEYQRHEAWAIARAFLDHFNGGQLTTGIIAGILRDQSELVPSSYQPIAGTLDNKKPLNFVKVTLMPGNKIYNGDDQNNGYYFFDNVAPGQYKLYFEAEDYAKDSANVTVTAHKSVFIDRLMKLQNNPNPPNLITSTPGNNSTDVRLSTQLVFNFDIRMDKTSVESAFSISPSVSGTFAWSNNDKTLTFIPTSLLSPSTNYIVTISTVAKTYFNVALTSPIQLSFNTRSKLNLLSTYPSNGDDLISSTVKIRLSFDAPIKSSTLPGNVQFLTTDNKNVELSVDQSAYPKGRIEFEPKNPLTAGAQYKVVVKSGVGDTENLTLGNDYEIYFTVDSKQFSEGIIKDDFENFQWGSPLANSVGIDSLATSFTQASVKKIGGQKSASLKYSFVSENATCRVDKTSPLSLGDNSESNFGVWVFGDLSNNKLQFLFADAMNNLYIKDIDLLNWSGWKMKSIKLGDVVSGNVNFIGFAVESQTNSEKSGTIYFDNVQIDFTTDNNDESVVPNSFNVSQNYPNPFNPATTIHFQLPQSSNVKIAVFDLLGREVVELINEFKPAGNYSISFDAAKFNMSSGIYFYKVTTGHYSKTMKMILLK